MLYKSNVKAFAYVAFVEIYIDDYFVSLLKLIK